MASLSRDYWPTANWRTASPQDVGIDAGQLAGVHNYTREQPTILGLLIVRSGYIVFEEYYGELHQQRSHNVNSVTKSVVSALVGIALRDGLLSSLEQPVLDFFPEYRAQSADPLKQAITLHHLLSMTSGFQPRPGESLELFPSDPNLLENILNTPQQHEPGEVYHYDDFAAHLLSPILTRATQMRTAAFALDRLFRPLGIWRGEQRFLWRAQPELTEEHHPFGLWDEQDGYLWSVESQHYHIGGFGLQLTLREMAKFGYLYLNDGTWDGQQIVPQEYIQRSFQPYKLTEYGHAYGYLWRVGKMQGHPFYFALGYGGQLVGLIPSLDLVIALASLPEQSSYWYPLVEQYIVPALR